MVGVLITVVFLLVPAGGLWALDQDKLLNHIRENYDIPAEVQIELGELKPSEVKGFQTADLIFRSPGGRKQEKLYVSDDGRFYQMGKFQDVSVHPDEERMRKINLKDAAGRGAKSAPVTVVGYTDFECYFCEKGYRMMQSVMKEFPGKVRWLYKSLPLTSIHPWAMSAAIAAECAGRQGEEKLWSLHDAFFENQKAIKRDNIDAKVMEFAAIAGVKNKMFERCYQEEATASKVQKDMQEAESLGISGTPAFLVNGHLIRGADGEKLRRIVREAIGGAHGRVPQ